MAVVADENAERYLQAILNETEEKIKANQLDLQLKFECRDDPFRLDFCSVYSQIQV